MFRDPSPDIPENFKGRPMRERRRNGVHQAVQYPADRNEEQLTIAECFIRVSGKQILDDPSDKNVWQKAKSNAEYGKYYTCNIITFL